MLTQDLLRESSPAISATFIPRAFLSSAMKAACSRMPSARLLEVLSRLRIAGGFVGPQRTNRARWPGAACARSDTA